MTQEFAAAKINLYLQVTGRRPDGYHTLNSLVVFADIGDILHITSTTEPSFEVKGPFAHDLYRGTASNLVERARRAVESYLGKTLSLSVTLEKKLPVASGIGGGSADAAALLRYCKHTIGAALPENALREMALGLGMDVWVCYRKRPAWVSGAGEHVSDVEVFPEMAIVLVNPRVELPTAKVFHALQGTFCEERVLPPSPETKAGWFEYIAAHTNSLEEPAVRIVPEIQDIICAIRETKDCRLSRMSGSGATCFGLYESRKQAIDAANALKFIFPRYWVEAGTIYGT